MMWTIFSVRDSKAKSYGRLFCAENADVVRRSLHESWPAARETTMGKYPEDYTLCALGSFDDEKGVVSGYQVELLDDLKTIATMRLTDEASVSGAFHSHPQMRGLHAAEG